MPQPLERVGRSWAAASIASSSAANTGADRVEQRLLVGEVQVDRRQVLHADPFGDRTDRHRLVTGLGEQLSRCGEDLAVGGALTAARPGAWPCRHRVDPTASGPGHPRAVGSSARPKRRAGGAAAGAPTSSSPASRMNAGTSVAADRAYASTSTASARPTPNSLMNVTPRRREREEHDREQQRPRP